MVFDDDEFLRLKRKHDELLLEIPNKRQELDVATQMYAAAETQKDSEAMRKWGKHYEKIEQELRDLHERREQVKRELVEFWGLDVD